MSDKQKPTIETIKKEAKEYYKWKNMIPRYIIIGFLFILVILQFVLPRSKSTVSKNEIESNTKTIVTDTGHISNFMENNIFLDPNNLQMKIDFENSLSKILDKKNELSFIYKYKKHMLDSIEVELEKEQLPTDFKYIILLNDLTWNTFGISDEIGWLYELKVDQQINEKLNYEKSLDVYIEYLKTLYKDFEDRNLVLIWYFMWSDDLKTLMMDQDQTDFEKLYPPRNILEKYFDVIAYTHIFNNITQYLDIKNVTPFEQTKTSKIKVGEIKDLVKRSKKSGYDFKLIKELNPWILWNSLPKWKREITVVN